MGSQTLARSTSSIIRSPTHFTPNAVGHSLSATAARILKLEASGSSATSYTWNKLLGLYSRRGPPHLAHKVFDAMPERDAVSYNTLITRLSCAGERARVYSRMLRNGLSPSGTTLSAFLAQRRNALPRTLLRQVHSHAVLLGLSSDAFVGSSLVSAYKQCGDADAAMAVFEEITEPDNVCWNAMINACTRSGSVRHAVKMLSRMRKTGGGADCFAVASILKVCSHDDDLGLGMQLHACAWKAGFESETATGNALITMYLKCGGGTGSAVKVFDRISEPNIISWTAMITGLVQNGLAVEAASFYKEMVRAGEEENDFCFTSVLPAFSALASLEHGKVVHCRVVKSVFRSDTIIGNALLDMYFKCGSSGDAQLVFDTMQMHDVVSWTAIIAGHGRHGEGKKAVEFFRSMIHEGFMPDSVVFLAALSACSHGGLVDEGLAIFRSMVEEHGIKPHREHCACLINLLGHAGRLEEAETLIRKMGMEVDSFAWESLLGACGIHGEVELGQRSAAKVMELEPWKGGPYVLLSNMYAERHRWREKETLRERLDGSSVRKDGACSWFPVSEAN